MAKFLLRLADDLYDYAQERADKENRSLNGFIVNLLEKHEEKYSENKKSESSDDLENLTSSYKLHNLYSAIRNNENIAIFGKKPRSGKSLLAKFIANTHKSIGRTVTIVSIHDNDSPESFYKSLKECAESSIKANKIHSFIIDEHASSKIFLSESGIWYLTELLKIIEEYKEFSSISFCLTIYINSKQKAQDNFIEQYFPNSIHTLRSDENKDEFENSWYFTFNEIVKITNYFN